MNSPFYVDYDADCVKFQLQFSCDNILRQKKIDQDVLRTLYFYIKIFVLYFVKNACVTFFFKIPFF